MISIAQCSAAGDLLSGMIDDKWQTSKSYSADVGIMNFGSPLDSVACCLMLVAGRPVSQRNFPAFSYSSARRDLKMQIHQNDNALHTQAWSPSPCSHFILYNVGTSSHTIPRDRASEFILLPRGFKMGPF